MARKDELDLLLRDERITDDEWSALGNALAIYAILSKSKTKRRYDVNEELRHCFGHTLANFLRNKYEHDYRFPILKETFESLGIPPFGEYEKISLIEEKLYNFIVQNSEIDLTDEKNFFEKLIEVGKDAWGFGRRIKNLSLKDGAVAVAVGLPLAAVNKTFFDTNWKKVIPAILIVGVIRKRLKILSAFEEIENGKLNN